MFLYSRLFNSQTLGISTGNDGVPTNKPTNKQTNKQTNMIKLGFVTSSRKIIQFTIDNRVVKYFDDMWKDGLQIYPKDEELIKRLTTSRDINIKIRAAFIIDANNGKDFEEYQACKSDEEIAAFITRDCRSQGLIEIGGKNYEDK